MITTNNNTELNKTLFPVTSQEVSNSNYLAIKNDDEIISIMSNKYSLVPNKEVWEAIEIGLNSYNATLKEAKVFKNLRTHWTILLGEEHKINIKVGDIVNTGIRIYNSYDGSKKLTITSYLERLACINGMVIDDVSTEWDARHLVGNIDMEVFPKKIEEIAVKSNEYISNNIVKLGDVKVTEERLLEFVEIFPQKLQEQILAQATNSDNFYDLLNAGTYVMSHIADREIESNIRLERELMRKTISMAGIS